MDTVSKILRLCGLEGAVLSGDRSQLGRVGGDLGGQPRCILISWCVGEFVLLVVEGVREGCNLRLICGAGLVDTLECSAG